MKPSVFAQSNFTNPRLSPWEGPSSPHHLRTKTKRIIRESQRLSEIARKLASLLEWQSQATSIETTQREEPIVSIVGDDLDRASDLITQTRKLAEGLLARLHDGQLTGADLLALGIQLADTEEVVSDEFVD